MSSRPFFYKQTNGIRVTVRPLYQREHSRPHHGQYVFAYFVRIENVGEQAAQLLSRFWLIRDSIGEENTVEGEGVIGEQPLIPPGNVHEYQSFCVLRSPNGSMEGRYHFRRADGSTFDADIPRFILDATAPVDPLQ
jgi:ApaG protein